MKFTRQCAQLNILIVSDFDDCAKDYNTEHPQVQFRTKMPSGPLGWALAATAPAFSRSHMDASGLATFIRIVFGMKLWISACNAALPGPDGWIDSNFKFQATLLKPGDDLYVEYTQGKILHLRFNSYMRPGVTHAVLTVEHSLTVGGHFFSSLAYWATLRAVTIEHFFGKYVTNTEHPECGIALFRSLCGILISFQSGKADKFCESSLSCKTNASYLDCLQTDGSQNGTSLPRFSSRCGTSVNCSLISRMMPFVRCGRARTLLLSTGMRLARLSRVYASELPVLTSITLWRKP